MNIDELKKPLSKDAVKTRSQGGRSVSYIEGWHAIAEANRIFGFDGWTRETIDIRCVSEREREIGQNKTPGFGVTYTVKVRVTVDDVVREGLGAGHGIDRDAGQAHESAIKEAETDAMKRALMTFGNPFGLALYDKRQENVADPEKLEALDKLDAKCREIVKAIGSANSEQNLADAWSHHEEAIAHFEKRAHQGQGKWMDEIMAAYNAKAADLSELLEAG